MILVVWAAEVSPYACTVKDQWSRDQATGDILAFYADVDELRVCIQQAQILRSVHTNFLEGIGKHGR